MSWMRKLILSVCLLLCVMSSAFAIMSDVKELPPDGVLTQDQMLTADLHMLESKHITNHGIIAADIYVCAGCTLIVQNVGNGAIKGEIHLADDAKLVQLITSDADITAPDFKDIPFDILVRGTDSLSLDKIVGTGVRAGKIVLQNVSLTIDDVAAVRNANIEFNGVVKIYVSDISELLKDPVLFEHISGPIVDVFVYSDDLGPMYMMHARLDKNNAMVLERTRNLNYTTILADVRGAFLDSLRDYDATDRLLRKLDAAETVAELESIMSRAARINPINLMRPVDVVNMAMMSNVNFNAKEPTASASIVSIQAADMDAYGITGGLHGKMEDTVAVSLNAYAVLANYGDDINDFSAVILGANIAADYDFKIAFIRALAGLSASKFVSGPVFDGTGATMNPTGIAFYGFADIGHRLNIGDSFFFSPFAGLGFNGDKILHQSGTDTFMRIGADSGFEISDEDMRYSYGVRAFATSAGDVSANLYVGAWLTEDAAGGEVSVGLINHDDICGISISVNGRMAF